MIKVNQNNEKETRQDQKYFHGTWSNVRSFFIGCKILKYFN